MGHARWITYGAVQFVLAPTRLSGIGTVVTAVEAGAELNRFAGLLAEEIAKRAPKDTGAGAASIHAEPDPEGGGYLVGWTREHFYLGFHELGTATLSPRPFVRPTVDEFQAALKKSVKS